jgi:membrane-bound ClpP family serine protease
MSLETVFKFVAYTVPALIVLGGILLLFVGYPIGMDSMVNAGWGLILLGASIYVLEIFLAYYSQE